MVTSDPTRRRLMAVFGALLGATQLPGRVHGQSGKDLPVCRTIRVFGAWRVEADDVWSTLTPVRPDLQIRGPLNKFSLPVTYKEEEGKDARRTPLEFRMNFYMTRAPRNAAFEVTVSTAAGGTRSYTETSRQKKDKEGETFLTLDLTDMLIGGRSLMSGTDKITIRVHNGGEELVSMAFVPDGFDAAVQFGKSEYVRLRAAEGRKECKSVNCFITTACCEVVGLSDDCFELKTLREFRDGPLQRMRGGQEDIARYYCEAPRILESIFARGEQHGLLRVYVMYILPCVIFARLGLDRLTRHVYGRMMRRLGSQHL